MDQPATSLQEHPPSRPPPSERVARMATPKELLGLQEATLEGIYGQGYRLYNTGKYREAAQLFRLLIMLNSHEAKYVMGLAACFHMMNSLSCAIETYLICEQIEPKNPLPYFHAADCYLRTDQPLLALRSLEQAIVCAQGHKELQLMRDRAEMTVNALKEQLTKKIKNK